MAMLTFNNITADSFAADTQQGAGRRRPRHREALSCSQCRDRKVRCDRKQPCKQCQTRGLSNSCTYGSSKDHTTNGYSNTNGNQNQQQQAQSHQNTNGHPHSHQRQQQQQQQQSQQQQQQQLVSQKQQQQQQHQQQNTRRSQTEPSSPLSSVSGESDVRKRLDRLELLLAASSTSHQSNGHHDDSRYHEFPSSVSSTASLSARNALQCPQGPLLSAKTRFIGGTHWMAACNNMIVLKAMLNKSPEFHTSHKSFAEIKAWTKSLNAVQVTYSISHTDASSLFSLLPQRATCELWVRTYCQTYRHVYDIVDELTLESAMEKAWSSNDDPTVVCIVIMIICVGMQSQESERLNGRRLARYVEQFAYASGLLHKPCIGSMKVLLLLTLLKTISCSDTESLDSLSGIMGLTTQVAMAMGLHRSPNAFGNITNYHSEIRKRLWWVFFRLNFEHCMKTGVPLALQPEDTDVGFPANVNLTDIASDGEIEVEGKELPYQTDATFGIIAARLAAFAAPYQRAICSASTMLPPDSIKHLRDAYHNLLTEAPIYMRPGAKTSNPAEEIQQAFLTIAMHSTSLILSLHFVINVAPDAVQKQHLLTVWDHSLSVLHSFQILSQKSQLIQTLAYQLLWSDACRAAFSAGMVLNRLRVLESKSIMATRLQHTLIPFQESLIKYLTFMSRFWFQSAHLGPIASKNCLLLAVVVAVTARLFSEDSDVSEKELVEVGARSVEQTVDSMKVAMKRRHSFPLSPEPSISSASHSTRMVGDGGRGVPSPNLADSWPTTTAMLTQSHQPNGAMMDPFSSSLGNVFGHPFITPDPSTVGWTPDMPWPMDPFEYAANSASLSPVSAVPARGTTGPYVDGLISPPLAEWSGTSQWVEDVGMTYS